MDDLTIGNGAKQLKATCFVFVGYRQRYLKHSVISSISSSGFDFTKTESIISNPLRLPLCVSEIFLFSRFPIFSVWNPRKIDLGKRSYVGFMYWIELGFALIGFKFFNYELIP